MNEPSHTIRADVRQLPVRTPATYDVAGAGAALAPPARALAEAACAFRAAAPGPRDSADLAEAFEHVERALAELAAGAEAAAYAVIESAGATRGARARPTPAARSVSWRLHALRAQLVAARDICAEVGSAMPAE